MPRAVECDVRGSRCSEVQSELWSGKARLPTKKTYFIIIPMHVMIGEVILGR